MTSKKRKYHTCKHHPGKRARGRCILCGAWVCTECSHLTKGQFFCSPSCNIPVTIVAHSPERPLDKSSFKPVVIGTIAGTVTMLCLLVLCIWLFVSRHQLAFELNKQKSMNATLSKKLKQSNEILYQLQTQEDQTPPTPVPSLQKRPQPSVPAPLSKTGLPFNFDQGTTAKKIVALTFDGAAYDNAAVEILDTLYSRGVKATMFVTGLFIKNHSDVVSRMLADGHELGNHTWSHPRLTTWERDRTQTTIGSISQTMLCAELKKTDDILYSVLGRRFGHLWRAPYGEINAEIAGWAQLCGYLHIGWKQARTFKLNLDTNDWIVNDTTPGYYSPQQVYDKIIALAQEQPNGINGGLVLMHLGTERKERSQQVHLILGKFIDTLALLGYSFVTTSEMLTESGVDVSILNDRK